MLNVNAENREMRASVNNDNLVMLVIGICHGAAPYALQYKCVV